MAKAILDVNKGVDYDIQAASGCDLQNFKDDSSAYYACVQTMIDETAKCDPTATGFDACMNRTTDGSLPTTNCSSNCVILVSTMRETRQELRTAWLGVLAATRHKSLILPRIATEEIRNTTVTGSIFATAGGTSAFEAASIIANCCSVTAGFPAALESVNPGVVHDATARAGQIMLQAAHEVKVEDANSAALVQNLLLDLAEAQNQIDIAVQQYNAMATNYNGVVGQIQHDVFESQRTHAYITAVPANDPSYRMVRDSKRLVLAKQLEFAARLSYLAARRAEYEYTARLSSNNFRISDIYKARNADDIQIFLQGLDGAINNLPGSVKDADINQRDVSISVAKHMLGLTDQFLQGQGFTGAALETERIRQFRQWVAQNSSLGSDGKPVLTFSFTLSADTKGIISNAIQQGYDFYGLHKVARIGQPKPASNGLGLNLLTVQSGDFGYRQVRVSQRGQVALTSLAGCLFHYRLIAPNVLLGLDYPNGQPTEVVAGAFNGDINQAHGNSTPGYSTPAFLGRPLAGTEWQVVIYPASPDGVLPDLNLQELNDIELKISTTHATRPSNAPPQPSECVRADF